MDGPLPIPQEEPPKKQPVVRGARACTVCRAAKMKCVGSEDGTKPCQRCKRADLDCIFEKHRRGRKPGSKLSEASKMLRRLEKGLTTAKLKSQANEAFIHSSPPDSQGIPSDYLDCRDNRSGTRFPANKELPPLHIPSYQPNTHNEDASDDDKDDRSPVDFYPARLIRKEDRKSFFNTILNPEHEDPISSSYSQQGSGSPETPSGQLSRLQVPSKSSSVPQVPDPITSGIMDEQTAVLIFDLVFLRLNPFINLFDPVLHSFNYVRSRSPLLFTALLMAGSKFFKSECYRPCQKLANELACRAFAEGWKSVEVVQAFACLVYWKEPDDTRTWTYIGYASRMAVELGLNRYVSRPSPGETEFQLRERRNRERTYLVLWVHDRSLSMQTGRQWMLPEDDLVKYSSTWHECGGSPIRPEDVILAAFVQLRRIATETMETTVFCLHRSTLSSMQSDVNCEVLLRTCNAKLSQWEETWHHQMQRASGESFHHAFLKFFHLYVRLFLNSIGVQPYISRGSRASPSLTALSICYASATETMQIVTKDFAAMSVLPYGQDSTIIMTAYCAVFLLKMLRSSARAELHPGAAQEIYSVISKAADAYHDASSLSPASGSAAYHARFLRCLIAHDKMKANRNDVGPHPIESRYHHDALAPLANESYSGRQQEQQPHMSNQVHNPQSLIVPYPPSGPVPASSSLPPGYEYSVEGQLQGSGYGPPPPSSQQGHLDMDAQYSKFIFLEMGYNDGDWQSPDSFVRSDGYVYMPTAPSSNPYVPSINGGFCG